LIAARGHAEQFNAKIGNYTFERGLHVMRLRERERAFASGDNERRTHVNGELAAMKRFRDQQLLLRTIIAFAFFALCVANVARANDPEPSSREWERILPVAVDLRNDGEKARVANKPILLFFNLTGCHFCRFSLRTALVPMFRDPKFRDAIEFRQITIDDGKNLIDFDGKKISSQNFAERRKATFTPTVMLVDGDGKQIGESIVGIASIDFYSGYVEELAKAAIEKVRNTK
jgi:thioredoxin-related protein